MNVVLVAEDLAGVHAMRCLQENDHRIVAVLTETRVAEPRAITVGEFAHKQNVPVWPLSLLADPAFANRITAEAIDLIISVHSLRPIHSSVARAAKGGVFNLHPGPLPDYPGANVVSWALFRGETAHGCTLHWGRSGPNSGAIAYESRFDVTESDGALTLYAKCVGAGIPLISRLLQDAAAGAIPLLRVDATTRHVFGDHVPYDGCLRWARPAAEIVNFVRACDYLPMRSPWGHPRARVRNTEFLIIKATRTYEAANAAPGVVGATLGRGVCVAGIDEWLLVTRVSAGGHHFDAADLLRTGDHVQDGAALSFAAQPIKAG